MSLNLSEIEFLHKILSIQICLERCKKEFFDFPAFFYTIPILLFPNSVRRKFTEYLLQCKSSFWFLLYFNESSSIIHTVITMASWRHFSFSKPSISGPSYVLYAWPNLDWDRMVKKVSCHMFIYSIWNELRLGWISVLYASYYICKPHCWFKC